MGHGCGQTETRKGEKQCLSRLAFYFLLFCCCVSVLQLSCQDQTKVAEADTVQEAAKEPPPSQPEAALSTPKAAPIPARPESRSQVSPVASSQADKPVARPQRPESKPKVSSVTRSQLDRRRANIRFENVVHDFGFYGAGKRHSCVF